MRKTPAPLVKSAVTSSLVELAGPRVATMRVAASRRILLLSRDKNGAEVVHTGERRPGHNEILHGSEQSIGVIVGKQARGIEPARAGTRQRVGAPQRAGIVLGPVDTVGIAGDGEDARRLVEGEAESEQEFDIAAAAAMAAHGDRGLAAG